MRRLVLLATLIALLLSAVTPALADPLVPARPQGAQAYGSKPPLYDDPRFELWAYTFDGQQATAQGYVSIYFFMNMVQSAKGWALLTALRLTEYALARNPMELLMDPAEKAMGRLDQLLWQSSAAPLVASGLALMGLWALLLRLGGRVRRAWSLLGSVVLLVFLAGAVASRGPQAVSSLVDLSRALASQVYGTVDVATQGSSPWGLTARAGDALWRTLIYDPWAEGELSEQGRLQYRTIDGLPGGEFLRMPLQQRQNICLYQLPVAERLCPWWTVEFLPRRMLLALWSTVATLVISGTLVFLAGGIVLGQLAMIFFLALSPLWLLIGILWPGMGDRVRNWVVTQTVRAGVSQVLLAATLSVFLMLTDAGLRTLSLGWVLSSWLLVGLAMLAVRFRHAWLAPVGLVTNGRERGAEGDFRKVTTVREGKRAPESSAGTAAEVRVPVHTSFAAPVGSVVVEAAGPDAPVRRVPPDLPGERQISPQREFELRSTFHQEMQSLRERVEVRQTVLLQERATVAGPEAAVPFKTRGQAGREKRSVQHLPRPRS